MKTIYQCDACFGVHDDKSWIFHCIDCGKEICESCMYGWSTCKDCARGKTRIFLKERFDKQHE